MEFAIVGLLASYAASVSIEHHGNVKSALVLGNKGYKVPKEALVEYFTASKTTSEKVMSFIPVWNIINAIKVSNKQKESILDNDKIVESKVEMTDLEKLEYSLLTNSYTKYMFMGNAEQLKKDNGLGINEVVTPLTQAPIGEKFTLEEVRQMSLDLNIPCSIGIANLELIAILGVSGTENIQRVSFGKDEKSYKFIPVEIDEKAEFTVYPFHPVLANSNELSDEVVSILSQRFEKPATLVLGKND